MKKSIYKINKLFVSADNSTGALEILKFLKLAKSTTGIEKICNCSEIIPTTENGKMILFEVTDNEKTEYITSENVSLAMTTFYNKHKSKTSFAKVVCFINEIQY